MVTRWRVCTYVRFMASMCLLQMGIILILLSRICAATPVKHAFVVQVLLDYSSQCSL